MSVASVHRRTLAKRRRCGLGRRSGSSPRKNGSSARALTMTAAADVIRATVHNRVDNQVRGASLANHRHRRSDRSRAVLLRCRVSRRDQSLRPSHTVVTSQTVRRLTGRAVGRRPVRGVRSKEGKSGPKALRAPSPRIRHRAYGPAGYRHDSSLSFGASKATASSSAPSPEDPIFHADEPRGPQRARLRVGVGIGSRLQARPVSRRYEHLENALAAATWARSECRSSQRSGHLRAKRFGEVSP